jgi:DNA repair protein RAD16
MQHVCFWNTEVSFSLSEDNQKKLADGEILTPIAKYGIETGGPGHTAFKKLKILLDRMMLR